MQYYCVGGGICGLPHAYEGRFADREYTSRYAYHNCAVPDCELFLLFINKEETALTKILLRQTRTNIFVQYFENSLTLWFLYDRIKERKKYFLLFFATDGLKWSTT